MTDAELLVAIDDAVRHDSAAGHLGDGFTALELRLEAHRRRASRETRPDMTGQAVKADDPRASRPAPGCRCHDSNAEHWANLRRTLPAKRYWYRYSLAHTKAMLCDSPSPDFAARLIALWPPRIQRALRARYFPK